MDTEKNVQAETGVRVPFLARNIALRRFGGVVQLATRLEVAVQRA